MFLDPREFGIVRCLEANWEAIRDEYLALPDEAFDPWVQRSMHGSGWSVYGLVAGGHQIPGGAKQCPRTSEILGLLDGIGLAGFSRMDPGTHIAAHAGWAENEYRLHLGLVVPDGCRLRVADETQHWREGKCLVFDVAGLATIQKSQKFRQPRKCPEIFRFQLRKSAKSDEPTERFYV